MNKKMADIDIDPFKRHDRTESRADETGENIPIPLVTPVGPGGALLGGGGRSTWEPTRE